MNRVVKRKRGANLTKRISFCLKDFPNIKCRSFLLIKYCSVLIFVTATEEKTTATIWIKEGILSALLIITNI